jgi:hypothetical protein
MASLALFILLNSLVFGGAALVARYGLKFRDALSIAFGAALVGWVVVVVGLEALATMGAIRLVPAACLAITLFAAGAVAWWRGRDVEPAANAGDLAAERAAELPAPCGGSRVSHMALIATAVLAAWAMLDVLVTGLCSPVLPVSDAPIYHLYFVVKWWQSGSLEIVPTPFGESAAPYFPANGDVWLTWLVLPWSSELLAKVGQWPFLPLGMAAVYGLARESDVQRESAAFPALLWGTGTLQLLHSGLADVDLIMAAWILVATWFLVRFGRERRLAQLVCAGLAAGAALGTKYVAMLFVPWLVLAAVFLTWKEPCRWRYLAAVAVSVTVPAVYWFARNAVQFGNPLYPLHVEAFGVTLLQGWYTRETLLESRYHIPVSDWRWFVLILLRGMDPALVPFWIGGILAGIVSPSRTKRLLLWLIGLACVHVVLYWLFNPYQTQDRFLFAAFALLAVPVAVLIDRWPMLSPAMPALLAIHLLVGPAAVADAVGLRSRFGLDDPDLPGLLSAVVPLTGRVPFHSHPVLRSRAVLLAALAAGAALFVWRHEKNWRRIVAGGLAFVLAATGVAFRASRSIIREDAQAFRFYPIWPRVGYTAGWLALDAATAADDFRDRPARVAYAGTNLPYYLFGRQLQNQVSYVNVNAHADFRLHDYHRLFASRGEPLATNSTPDWDRRETDELAWLENLRGREIDLLFIGFTNAAGGQHNFYDAEGFPIERTWADRHPEAFTLLHADARTRLYAVRFQ